MAAGLVRCGDGSPHFEQNHDLWEQFVQVYAGADEIADDPAHRAGYEADILAAARSRLDMGGFEISAR